MQYDSKPLTVFRVDGGSQIGSGHVVRCLALAEALDQVGWQCVFAGSSDTVDIVTELFNFSYEWWPLSADTDGSSELSQMKSHAESCNLLVVDHYKRDFRFESSCRNWADKIFVIDDLVNRTHDADILHDPLVGRDAEAYFPFISDKCLLLLGPHYMPLRSQFFRSRSFALAAHKNKIKVDRIMVSLGASDPENYTEIVLKGLSDVSNDISIDVVMGSSAPHLRTVRKFASTMQQEVNVHIGVTDMARMMNQCDMAIGAAGISSWERCVLGLPTLLVVTAENQRAVAQELGNRNAVKFLGDGLTLTPGQVSDAVHDIIQSPRILSDISHHSSLICDGRGASRLAMVLAPEFAKDGNPVILRPAIMEDAEFMLTLQCTPGVRRYARNSSTPNEDEHRNWIAKRMTSPDCLLNIILYNDTLAGVLRLDAIQDTSQPAFEVSILIEPGMQGKGLGSAALTLARRLVPEAELVAEVHQDNKASHALFCSANFTFCDGVYRLIPGEERHL